MILAAAFTLAQLADLVTARSDYEVHPVGQALLAEFGWPVVAKIALIALVCATAAVCRKRDPWAADYPQAILASNAVLVAGTVGGLIGTWSNL